MGDKDRAFGKAVERRQTSAMKGASATIASVMPWTSVEPGGMRAAGIDERVEDLARDAAAIHDADRGDLHDLVAVLGQVRSSVSKTT